jgi:hypothetical protein
VRVRLPINEADAEPFLPENRSDGSGVGINYADALLKPVKLTLEDGRKVSFKRRGLKITVSVGGRSGDGLLRRLQHEPDVKAMVREALREAARNAGCAIHFEAGGIFLEA